MYKGDVVNVPVFLGFNNISLDKAGEIETDWGVLFSITEDISELTPNKNSKIQINNEEYNNGFVLKSTYPYKVNFGKNSHADKRPKELDQARTKLNEIIENVGLSFSLAIQRTSPVGISNTWTMIFDPLSHGTNIAFKMNTRSPTKFHILKDREEKDELAKGSHLINITIALHRILSAINQRNNPIDGFIDTIISWENLFGGKAELGFRISVSIAKLLGENEQERQTLQKTVSNYHNIRSRLLHGGKEPTPEDATKYKDECFNITLRVIRKLYQEKAEFIQNTNRSKTLALM